MMLSFTNNNTVIILFNIYRETSQTWFKLEFANNSESENVIANCTIQ